jgi:hypothetical protein
LGVVTGGFTTGDTGDVGFLTKLLISAAVPAPTNAFFIVLVKLLVGFVVVAVVGLVVVTGLVVATGLVVVAVVFAAIGALVVVVLAATGAFVVVVLAATGVLVAAGLRAVVVLVAAGFAAVGFAATGFAAGALIVEVTGGLA